MQYELITFHPGLDDESLLWPEGNVRVRLTIGTNVLEQDIDPGKDDQELVDNIEMAMAVFQSEIGNKKPQLSRDLSAFDKQVFQLSQADLPSLDIKPADQLGLADVTPIP